MSDYIIHNICFNVSPKFDLDGLLEQDKPVDKYPNFYVGKAIGGKGKELNLKRTRKSGEEDVPNLVLRNADGIALIRIHNKEDLTIVNLPENTEKEVRDCDVESRSSYPFSYVVVDYRDGKCQLAIEKTSAWESKTVTIRNSLQKFFNDNKLLNSLGISIALEEKKDIKDFERFIDQRTIDHGDVIESFTFEYVNMKRKPQTRIPPTLSELMDMYSKILEIYGAVSGSTTMKMESPADNEKLKQLSSVLAYSVDNAFDLKVKFKDFGEYSCSQGVVVKYPMNDIVISNFKDFKTPDVPTADFDLRLWLDDVFNRVKGINDGEKIPTKPTR